MSNIFDDDSADSDVEIRTNNEYAKNYNIWRKKEEINKLKTKYGEDVEDLDQESSSSSDDEDGVKVTREIERDFFKTLACLKNKDPRIYNENVNFFQNNDQDSSRHVAEKKKKNKEGPMYLKDYERKIILEKGGVLSDEEDVTRRPRSPTYAEEQEYNRESLKKIVNSVEDDEDSGNELAGMLKPRKKTQEEKNEEEEDYKKWLAGEEAKISKDVERELKPLKEYWNNPDLEEGEMFLRDYILNKKFLEKDDQDYIPTYDEIIHDSDQDLSNDEDTIEKQEAFEHKFNFRFEEPDEEFIKRYPRTVENSLRKKDDRRKLKRQEVKERKKKEKEEKMQELKKLQELKRIEIEEKLEKLKEIVGDSDIGFADEDIDGDFDPDAHDRRMQTLFNDEYYQGAEEEQKPVFPDIDEELEIENWDRYEGENDNELPHCEDENFNMDCDYNPTASTQDGLIEKSKSKKRRKRKSKVAEALSKPKPKYDPNDKNYEKYFDEYYKLDCEDIIGDIPCKFKYREVAPNDFGLSIEEILLANERELNKWCSLKKAVQIRPDNVEKYEQIAYKRKAQNINLKKKIFPSLFTPDAEEESKDVETLKNLSCSSNLTNSLDEKQQGNQERSVKRDEEIYSNERSDKQQSNEGRSMKQDEKTPDNGKNGDVKRKKKKKRNKNSNPRVNNDTSIVGKSHSVVGTEPQEVLSKEKAKIKKKTKRMESNTLTVKKDRKRKKEINGSELPRKKFKKSEGQNKNVKELSISDARLSAYGINPKKFKNKMKYGNRK